MAKPFLKWAGGKGKLAPLIAERVGRESINIARYHEPFLGGGAVFFALHEAGLVRDTSLADSNAELIGTYQAVRDDVEGVIAALGALSRKYLPLDSSKRTFFYYDIRDRRRPRLPATKAARLLFLNKTCYNGLYRVNSKGHFNVPHGRYKSLRLMGTIARGVQCRGSAFGRHPPPWQAAELSMLRTISRVRAPRAQRDGFGQTSSTTSPHVGSPPSNSPPQP